MAVKKIEELNIHRDVNSTEQFDVQGYLNENWDKMQDVVDNNAEELMQVQKDISTLKEDNKTNKSSIDVLEKSNETRDEKISKNVEDIEAIQRSIKAATETINKKDNEQDEDIKANKESIKEIQAENERLREDIKSIATIGEASGENIHIEDSSNARCEIEIGGNQKQETREGYNLLDLSNFSTQTKNNVTATKNEDGSIKLVGTNSGDTFNINLSTINGEIGDYIASGVMGGSKETYFLGIVKPGVKTFAEVTNESSNFSLTEETTIAANIYIIKGATINTTIYPMLIKGTKNKPYEQYGASPSIDFPSELKAVGDDINILNDTIFARKGYHSGIVGATIQKVNTTIRLLTDEDINVISNKDITISLGTDKDLKYNVFEIDKNDVIIKNNMSSNNKDKTIKLQENTKKISLMLMWQDANKTIILEDIKDCKIKIAYGTSINNYSFYNCGSAKVDIVNKNIFKEISNKKDIKKAYFNIIGGILNIKKGEICIISFDTNNNQGGLYLNEDIFLFQGNYSVTCDGKRHYLIGKAKEQINTNVTILKTNKETTNNYDISNVLVTKYDASNVDTKYIKHQEQSYLVDVQQPMFEGDKFIKTDGKWYEKHCVKTEIMLTFPTTNIEVCGTFANFQTNRNIAFAVVKNDLKITNVRNDILCDKLKAKDNSMWGGKEDGIQTYINSNKFMISIPFEDIEKNFGEELTINNYSQAFRKYINDNGPFKIYYLLEEPELVECTEAQNKVLDEIYNKAHTYKNITNISAESAEVNPTLNIKYLKDAETEHNKLQAQIDEIKQLLSSTETSALLVNNLEKDLRMEVE